MKSNKLLILPVVLTTITLLTGIILSSTLTHADGNTDVVDELDITVNSACTMKGGPNGTDDSGSSTYTTTINAGNYTELSGSKLVTLCNDSAGYAIYAIGFSGDSYDSETHTDLIGTATTGNIPTGTSGNDSYWAMKLEAVEGLTPPSIVTDFQNYHVIPSTYTKVASYTAPTATASDAGATVQTKYKINISKTQLAGSYNGKVKYTMVHPSAAPAPTPTVTFDDAFAAAGKTKQGNYYKMQDGNTSICAAVTPGQTGTLIDTRGGGTTYSVTKIGDLCWMTTNLDLAGGTALSADDTDVTSAYISSFTTSNNLTKSGNTIVLPPSTTDSGFDKDNYSYVANSGNASSDCSTDPGCYSYYSWDAATLGSGRSISTDNTGARQSICPKGWHLPNTRTGTNDTSDFRKLMIALGGSSSIEIYDESTTPTGATMSTTLQSSPNSFLLAGYYYYGSFANGDSLGYCWSSTSSSSTGYALRLYFNSSRVYSAGRGRRNMGNSVRCVLGSS